MLYLVYNVVLTAAFIVGVPFLPVIAVLGERYRRGLGERLGLYGKKATTTMFARRPIWIHAASVGEVKSAGRLATELRERFPDAGILLTTFTHTGHEMARRVTAADLVLFFPLDFWWIVRRALNTLDPSLIIFLETEIWPNFLHEAHRRGIPTVLLSGRLSPRAFKRYSFFGLFFRNVIQCLTAMGMQSEEDVDRMIELGADKRRIVVTGSLKRAAATKTAQGYQKLVAVHGEREGQRSNPMLVVGSSHRGEEEILLNVFAELRCSFPNLQMVLAPRHPQRFAEVERLLEAKGLPFEKKSEANGRFNFDKDVMFLDTMGDLPDFYAIGDIAFVGGSLVDAGGHNLLEPALFHKPVIFGPYMTNFSSLAKEMKQSGAGIEVSGADDLVREISALLSDADKRRTAGENAYRFAANDHGVLERSVILAARYLQSGRVSSGS